MLFKRNQQKYTMGVELEFQLINPHTLDLEPKSPQILKGLKQKSAQIKAELFRSMIEINTTAHTSLKHLEEDLLEQVNILMHECEKHEIELSGTGTHPFAKYKDRVIYPDKRYNQLLDRRQYIARRLQIFGMHIHIGCTSKKHVIELNNFFLHYLPLLQALSASSPFWQGQETGLLSYRSTIFEAMPTAGHPEIFKNWREFEKTVQHMKTTKSIKSHKDIWWDIRPSLDFGTLEIRVFDGMNRIEDVMALTYFVRSLCDLFEFYQKKKVHIPLPTNWIWRENKWRACRYGVNALLIAPDFQAITCKAALKQTISIFNKYIPHLYNKEYHQNLKKLIQSTSAERQIRLFKKEKNIKDVVRFNIQELKASFK